MLQKPEVLIFDIGKVLIDFDLARFQQRIADASTITLAELQRNWDKTLVAVESGKVDPHVFYADFAASIGLSWNYEEWTQAWADIYSIHEVGHALFLRLQRAGQRVAILSNLAAYNAVSILRKFPDFFSVTPHNFFSFELGLHKPDPAIYTAVCQALRVTPEQCLFLDDNADNVAGAQSIGMPAHHFVPTNYANIHRQLEPFMK